MLIDSLPYTQISERLPGPVARLLDGVPILRPVLPDPGVPFQLVHRDDVAAAMRAAVLGRGSRGVYNLAGPGELTVKQLAQELGWYSIPVPELAVDAVAETIGRLGFLPAQAQWISAFREPVIMDTAKARRELRWRPRARRAVDAARDDRRGSRPGAADPLGEDQCTRRICANASSVVDRRISQPMSDVRRRQSRPAAPRGDRHRQHALPARSELIERWQIDRSACTSAGAASCAARDSYTDLDAFYAQLHDSAACRRPRSRRPETSSPATSRSSAPGATCSRSISPSGLSGTCESAREAARLIAEAGHAGRVEVLDSQTGAGGLGCLVLVGRRSRRAGRELDESAGGRRAARARAWTSGSAWTRSSTCAAAGASAQRRRSSARR